MDTQDMDRVVKNPGINHRFPIELYQVTESLWQTDIESCKKLIQQLYQKYPEGKDNIWFAGAEAEVALFQFYCQESDSNEAELINGLERIGNIAKKMYTTYNPKQGMIMGNFYETLTVSSTGISSLSLFLEAVLGYAFYYLVYAMINFRKQERVSGAYYFRKSWKYFEQAMAVINKHKELKLPIDPKMAGYVNFGCGLFHFIMSLVPPNLQFVVSLVGFVADREHAMEELQLCVNSGCTRAIEATMVLALLKKFFTDEEEEGDRLMEKMQKVYPEAIVVCYLSGFIERLKGDLDKSIQFFEKGAALVKEKMYTPQLYTTTQYHLGYCYFMKNNWEKAAQYFEVFLKEDVSNTGKRFRPYTSYQLGYCYWRLGRREEIVPLYNNAQQWVRLEQSFDKFAQRKMNKFIKENGFSAFDEAVISAASLIEGRLYKQAVKTIESVIPLLKDPNNKDKRDCFGTYYYLKGDALKGLKMFDRAKSMFERVVAEDGHLLEETYLVPYAWVALAEIAMEEGVWNVAESHLAKASTYTDYDWAQLLSFRIYSDSQKLTYNKKKANK